VDPFSYGPIRQRRGTEHEFPERFGDTDEETSSSVRTQFGQVDDQYDPGAVEERVFDYWDEVDAYERTVKAPGRRRGLLFVDGPPYTSGSAPHGSRLEQEPQGRLHPLQAHAGFRRHRPAGLRHARPPHRDQGRREMDFANKKDIEEYGVENFIDACREFAEGSLDSLQSDFIDFGVWMDWDDPYKTINPEYMEAAWWGSRRPTSATSSSRGCAPSRSVPRCETAIANNEVEYEDVEDPSIYVKFPSRTGKGSSSSGRRRRGPSPQTPSLPSTATSTTSASTPRKTARPSGSTSPKSASRTSCTRAATTTTRSSRN